ncbi:bifunctional diguanylate cyclase/phosphodiesterase [Massilia sp. S19_KUP03_FR1]|uniref:bifunctional diguanylate cyclase/phosphodiesterase n=1 Tax=Massilia sp. S19_KUP03_FR1 TaxID=3025503 RepID=UPI002FCDC890
MAPDAPTRAGKAARPRLALALDTHISLPLFALVLLVAVWIVTFHFIGVAREHAIAAARAAAREHVDTYEAQLGRNLASIDQTLKVLKYAVEINGPAGALAALREQALLPSTLVFVVSVADKNGSVVASNPYMRPINVARERYFTIHRDQPTSAPFISQTMRDEADPEPHLHFTRRLNDAAGAFAGIAIIEADPAYFTSAYEQARQGQHGALGLIGNDGIARALRVGEQLSWGTVVPVATARDDVVSLGADLPDRVPRYTAMRRLHGFDVTAMVALAQDEQLAPYRKLRANYLLAASGASAALALIVALVATWSWQLARTRRGVRRAKETYAAASEASPDAFFVIRSVQGADGDIVDFIAEDINSRAEALTGLTKAAIAGRHLAEVLPAYRKHGIFDDLKQVAQSGRASETEWQSDRTTPDRRWLQRQVVPVESGLVIIVRDITERKMTEQRIFHMAHHDELTGLPNRLLVRQCLERAILGAAPKHTGVALAFIDLDGFKLVNDGLGHNAGDELLKIVGARMQACMRRKDTLGRFGGDEFVIVMPVASDDALALAPLLDKIRRAVNEPVLLNGQSVQVSCSMGVVMYPRDGLDASTLLMNADAAMYRAKELGHNNFQFYAREMNASVEQKLVLLDGLRTALDTALGLARGPSQLSLVYQPKIDLRSGRMFGVEALLRWDHPEFGAISPLRFIPLAEESGMIVALGDWVVRTACRQNQAWRDAGLDPITISVNVSPRQFEEPALVERIAAALAHSALAPQGLELEVTESLIMRDLVQSVDKMRALKAMGMSLSIDDFGTGYSSLSALKSFPISTLKIDKSFIRDVVDSADDQAITMAVISLAHKLNLRVIAEGVETEQQRTFLRSHDCDEMQGYLFSPPVPAARIASLLATQADAKAGKAPAMQP